VAETATIAVLGMGCGGCERTVRTAVAELPGVVSVSADHVAEEAEVSFDPARVGLDEIRAAVCAAGFQA
jgi:copper chaperone